jgi:hypothetical protein
MANTEQLLALALEFPEAFQDTETTPPRTEPEKSSVWVETDDDELTHAELAHAEWCQYYLSQLEYQPSLLAIAASFLSELADVASLRQHLANEPVRQSLQKLADDGLLNLPETYARQSTPDCPSGACPIDH